MRHVEVYNKVNETIYQSSSNKRLETWKGSQGHAILRYNTLKLPGQGPALLDTRVLHSALP